MSRPHKNTKEEITPTHPHRAKAIKDGHDSKVYPDVHIFYTSCLKRTKKQKQKQKQNRQRSKQKDKEALQMTIMKGCILYFRALD